MNSGKRYIYDRRLSMLQVHATLIHCSVLFLSQTKVRNGHDKSNVRLEILQESHRLQCIVKIVKYGFNVHFKRIVLFKCIYAYRSSWIGTKSLRSLLESGIFPYFLYYYKRCLQKVITEQSNHSKGKPILKVMRMRIIFLNRRMQKKPKELKKEN